MSDSILSLESFPSASFHPSNLSGGFVKASPRTCIAGIDLETRLPFLSSLRSVDRLNFQPPTRKVLLDDEVPCVKVKLKEQGERGREGGKILHPSIPLTPPAVKRLTKFTLTQLLLHEVIANEFFPPFYVRRSTMTYNALLHQR